MSSARFTTAELAACLDMLVGGMAPALDDGDRIERVRLFEQIKAAAAAAQAVETTAFAVSQRADHAVAGLPTSQQGRGVAAQIGLARRTSPWHAARYVGWSQALTVELPGTFAALQAGETSEWRAMLVARETIWLSAADRALVDRELAPQLAGWSDRRVEAEARKAAYRLDPHGSLARSSAAHADRRVTVRPAPDTMCRLTALLPVAQGVAAYASLTRAADTTTAVGDERGRGQIMADTLVERLTGQSRAEAVPVEIELLMTDRSLFGGPGKLGRDEPAELIGYGPVPAGLARDLALGASSEAGCGTSDEPTDAVRDKARHKITAASVDVMATSADVTCTSAAERALSVGDAPRWLRRLYADPDTGQLAKLDSRRRLFTAAQRRFVRLNDLRCRTPYCDAQIRHIDHLVPAHDGGPTSTDNARGTCQACNYARQGPGWHVSRDPGFEGRIDSDIRIRPGTIMVVTPTGHCYFSDPPDLPGTPAGRSPVEIRVRQLLAAA